MTDDHMRPAHLGWRVVQAVIDDGVVAVCALALADPREIFEKGVILTNLSDFRQAPFESLKRMQQLLPAAGVVLMIYWCVKLPYQLAFLTLCKGQTIGCRVLRLRVTLADGRLVSWRAAAARTIGAGILAHAPVVGRILRLVYYLAILADKRRQAVRDMVAGTVVVHEAPSKPTGLTNLFVSLHG